jgi:hypothetical protein
LNDVINDTPSGRVDGRYCIRDNRCSNEMILNNNNNNISLFRQRAIIPSILVPNLKKNEEEKEGRMEVFCTIGILYSSVVIASVLCANTVWHNNAVITDNSSFFW